MTFEGSEDMLKEEGFSLRDNFLRDFLLPKEVLAKVGRVFPVLDPRAASRAGRSAGRVAPKRKR